MVRSIIGSFICLLVIYSCNERYSPLDKALRFAGKNRGELEKVLNYYKQDERDSLKYKAACFLIENMPYHYAYENEDLKKFRKNLYPVAMEKNCTALEAYHILERKFGPLFPQELDKKYDSHIITTDYLIRNIDFSFKVWNEKPWGKYLSFDDFCEEILPYRIGNEPLEEWKETYYNYFQPILDSLQQDRDPVSAYHLLYDTIVQTKWIFEEDIPMPNPGAINLLKNRIGGCRDAAALGVYVMRALGIPSGIDFIVQNPDKMYKTHYWAYIRNISGKIIETPFMKFRYTPEKRKLGVVYRQCFSLQQESLPVKHNNIKAPYTLKDSLMKNVSHDYFIKNKVEISVPKIANPVLFLGVFNNRSWIPVAWSENINEKITFSNLEPNIVYLVLCQENDIYHPVSLPFIPNEDGNFVFIQPDTTNLQTMQLFRKHPLPFWWQYAKENPVGGKFQLANRPDFTDAIIFHTITTIPDMVFQSINFDHPGKFKYIRYLSSDNGYCGLAELQVFSTYDLNVPLTGKIIGTNGSGYKDRTKEKVFDNDPITFYEAKEAGGSWVGLELDTMYPIRQIRFIFRNDDNNIRWGDEYELSYWHNNQFISCEKKTADSSCLIYTNIPSKGLYLLHNHTRGKEERIFTYENGIQTWW